MNPSNSSKRPCSDDDQKLSKRQKVNAIYLEDYTPVRTVEVTNIPKNASSEYLRGYFEHASGPVENVNVVHKLGKDMCEQSAAYVTFTIPEDAAKLICDANLLFDIKFTVKEAEAIHQPKINPNSTKLEQINDDCLLHIISYLNLLDVVHLAETCIRLNLLIQPTYKKFRRFSFGKNTADLSLNLLTLPRILQDIGSYIRTMEIVGLNLPILETLAEHCGNVKVLKINSSNGTYSKVFQKNKSFFKKLTRLEICMSGFWDTSMKYICSSPKLTSLKIISCRHIRGTFFSKLKKLKILTIQNCQQVRIGDWWNIYRENNQLIEFSSDVREFSFVDFLEHAATMSGIQKLELDFSRFEGDVKQLENLKYLTQLTNLSVTRKYVIHSTSQNFDNLLIELSKIGTLESLNIEHIEISDDTLKHLGSIKSLKSLHLKYIEDRVGNILYLTLPQHLPNLRELSLQMHTQIDPNSYTWISKMVADLRKLEYFSHSSLTISLLETILKDLKQVNKKSTLKVGIPSYIFDTIEMFPTLLWTQRDRKPNSIGYSSEPHINDCFLAGNVKQKQFAAASKDFIIVAKELLTL